MNVLLMPSKSNFGAIDAILIYKSTKREPVRALLIQITLNTAHSALSAQCMTNYLKHLQDVLKIARTNISLVTLTTVDRIQFMKHLEFKFDGPSSSSVAQELNDLNRFAIAVDAPIIDKALDNIAHYSIK